MKLSPHFPPTLQAWALLALGSMSALHPGATARGEQEDARAEAGAQLQLNLAAFRAAREERLVAAAAAELAAQPAPPASASGPHLLEGTDGVRLHGTLQSLDTVKGSVLWQHPAVSAPLALSLAPIRRLSFGEDPRADVKARASLKFVAGGWLAGEVKTLEADAFQCQLEDGSKFSVARGEMEWISFSKGRAPECFDGPTSLEGWTSTGLWTYRDGALHPHNYAPIQRVFAALPDLVEYRLDADQGPASNTFSIVLRGMTLGLPNSKQPATNEVTEQSATISQTRELKITRTGSRLRLAMTTKNGGRTEDVDLSAILPPPPEGQMALDPPPVKLRLLQNNVTGKILIFVNHQKVKEWTVTRAEPGKNGGTFVLEATYVPGPEQSFSKIQVLPWDGLVPNDGEPEIVSGQVDRVFLTDGHWKEGRLTGLSREQLSLKTTGGELEIPRETISMVRLSRAETRPTPQPVGALVRLAQRGEFEASSVGWHEGKIHLKTRFGAELAVSPKLLGEVQFPSGIFTPPAVTDVLVFQDGDRLPGLLEASATNRKVSWRPAAGESPVEIAPAKVAGLLLGVRPNRPVAPPSTVTRFRNGDWLAGEVVQLDQNQLQIQTAEAGPMRIPKAQVQALYFGAKGQPAFFDASAQPELWQRPSSAFSPSYQQLIGINGLARIQGNIVINGGALIINEGGPNVVINEVIRTKSGTDKAGSAPAQEKTAPMNDWAYVDGSFTLLPTGASGRLGRASINEVSLNRVFDALPSRVEIDFDVTLARVPFYCFARLFSESGNNGYNLTVSPQQTTIRDIGTVPRRTVASPSDRGLIFDNDLHEKNPAPRQRHIRIFADRLNDTVTVFDDGKRTAQLKPKTAADIRKLGRGVMLSPSSSASGFSNITVRPWSGQLPDEAPAPEAARERVVLANGDEAQGTIRSATAKALQMESEIGPLSLGLDRLSMIDFGGEAGPRPAGTRLRLAGRGTLTVLSYAIANDEVTCQSETLGELKFPLAAVQEVDFASPAEAADPAAPAASPEPAPAPAKR